MKNRLTETFNSISVRKGELFTLELPTNASTGYSWQIDVVAGKAQLLTQDYVDLPPAGMVGGGCTQRLLYRADEAGEIEIRADYRRPWENTPPAKSHTFKISVQ